MDSNNNNSSPHHTKEDANIRFKVPHLSQSEWKALDSELQPLLAPLHQLVGAANDNNRRSIQDIAHYTVMNNPKALGKSLSRESVIASYYIFLNRNEKEWNSTDYS